MQIKGSDYKLGMLHKRVQLFRLVWSFVSILHNIFKHINHYNYNKDNNMLGSKVIKILNKG